MFWENVDDNVGDDDKGSAPVLNATRTPVVIRRSLEQDTGAEPRVPLVNPTITPTAFSSSYTSNHILYTYTTGCSGQPYNNSPQCLLNEKSSFVYYTQLLCFKGHRDQIIQSTSSKAPLKLYIIKSQFIVFIV